MRILFVSLYHSVFQHAGAVPEGPLRHGDAQREGRAHSSDSEGASNPLLWIFPQFPHKAGTKRNVCYVIFVVLSPPPLIRPFAIHHQYIQR